MKKMGMIVLMVLLVTTGISFGQNTASELYNRCLQYGIQGKFKEAKDEIEKAFKIDPYNAGAEIVRKVVDDYFLNIINSKTAISIFKASYYEINGNYEDAIKVFNLVVANNPNYALAYNERGLCFENRGDYEYAILDYKKSLEINPKFAAACLNLGNVYQRKGEYYKAIAYYNRSLKINPNFPEAYTARGSAYDNTKQYDKAISDYNKAIKINPLFGEAYYNRGNLYMIKLRKKK